MPHHDEPDPGQARAPTPTDLHAYITGEATPEQMRLVQAALDDPNSEANKWVKRVESWARGAFPLRCDAATGRVRRQTAAMEQLDAVLAFAQDQRAVGVISHEELLKIQTAGGLDDWAHLPKTPSDALAATARMIGVMNALHPELSTQIARISGRFRE